MDFSYWWSYIGKGMHTAFVEVLLKMRIVNFFNKPSVTGAVTTSRLFGFLLDMIYLNLDLLN